MLQIFLPGVITIRNLTIAYFCLLCATGISDDTGTIVGSVKFEGNAPVMEKLKVSFDPFCSKLYAGNPPSRPDVIVNPNKTLRNVIVHIKQGLPVGKQYPVPTEPAVLDQRGCMYEPHVLALRAGQDLKVLNSDKTVHNINAQAQANGKFNFSMISDKVPPQIRKFAKPEMPIKIKCDVHPWMLAWAGVFDHPYFSVSGEDGKFDISKLPAGDFVVEAWHEKYGTQQKTIKVIDGQTQQVEFTFAADAGSR